MKRMRLCLLIAALALLWAAPAFAEETRDIRVAINGEPAVFDVPPVIVNGRVLVPVRGVMEKLGADVSYRPGTREVAVSSGGLSLKMTLDQSKVLVNGLAVHLETPPAVVDGRLMVPLRFIGEYLGYEVAWDGEERLVEIREKSEAFRLLYRAYLHRCNVPFVTLDSRPEGLVLHEPLWKEPFSFSGLYEFRAEQDGRERSFIGERTGRWNGGKYLHKTQGFLRERTEAGGEPAEAVQIRSEFVQDAGGGIAFIDEGNGPVSAAVYDPLQLDEQSGFVQHLLAYLMLNHDALETGTLRVEGRTKTVLSLSAANAMPGTEGPLLRMINTLWDGFKGEPAAVQADVSVRLDAGSLRVEQTDVSLAVQGERVSAEYTAIYHYTHELVAPVVIPKAAEAEKGE